MLNPPLVSFLHFLMYNIKTMAYQGCDGRERGGREGDRLRGRERERERREAGGERGEAGGDVLAGSRPAQDQEKNRVSVSVEVQPNASDFCQFCPSASKSKVSSGLASAAA